MSTLVADARGRVTVTLPRLAPGEYDAQLLIDEQLVSLRIVVEAETVPQLPHVPETTEDE